MKLNQPQRNIRSLALALGFTAASAFGFTFTSNTTIGAGDLTYDGQDIVVSNCTLTVNGPHTFNNLSLQNNALLTHTAAPNGEADNRLALTLLGGCVVQAGSRIDASGRGYAAGAGPGAGIQNPSGYGSGAGHGGTGGTPTSGGAGGGAYDVVLAPGSWGSGGGHGGGGAGGGVIRLEVAGTLQLDGVIAADGVSPGYPAGGGAGGSIHVSAGNLAGGGSISAQGGSTVNTGGGGGGGGRIALYFTTSSFAGAISAAGGAGQEYGGAGTIYSKLTAATQGLLRVDNAGNAGQWTPLTTPEPFALVVGNQARVYASAALTNQTLTVETNGLLSCVTGQSNLSLTVLGDATVAAGGRIDVGGRGYAAGVGPGAGSQSVYGYGSGGGHGGTGGDSFNGGYWGAAPGGGGYDSVLTPGSWGSGGGHAGGGAGGGAIRLAVAGTLQLDGTIAADGVSSGYPAGGGAGGSIHVSAGKLAGGGSISAQGGSTVNTGGGGGGGGRIALYFATNIFTGAISAAGGAGAQYGGAGTLYTKSAALGQLGHLLVDNAGNRGLTRLNTNLWSTGTLYDPVFHLTIAGNALVKPEVPLTFVNLVLTNGATLSHDTGQSGFHVTALGDALIAAGASINVSQLGFAAATGPGAGSLNAGGWGSGGSHGGNGGPSFASNVGAAPGGPVYDSILAPVELGSGGGGSDGGAGGGAVRLTVAGTLRVDGTISADGAPPSYAVRGAGAGGSIYLTANTLAGSGSLSANGAALASGGGGGGRIALHYNTSTFNGSITARGGTGTDNHGGAGTICTKLAAAQYAQVLVDNGGQVGLTRLNSALWPAGALFDLTLAGSALVKPDAPLTFVNLVLTNGAILTHDAGQSGFYLTALGNALIAANASINVDGLGYGSQTGPGAGSQSVYGYGSGAGHGGAGQASYAGEPPQPVFGGGTYGSATEPITLGSGGGANGGGAGGPGGAGGGAIRLTVAGTLQLDGAILANGLAGEPQRGSGAGGSIWITADTLAGSGSVSALGGGASAYGAAGGGGRIAIYTYSTAGFDTNHISFAGAAGPGTLLFGYPPPRPSVEVAGSALRVSWRTGSGASYQLWSTPNFTTWSPYGPLRAGTGGILTQDCPMTNSPGLFFRVQMAN